MNMSETIELAFLKSAFWDTYILQSTYYVVCSLVVLHSGLKSFMKLKYFFTKETLVYVHKHALLLLILVTIATFILKHSVN